MSGAIVAALSNPSPTVSLSISPYSDSGSGSVSSHTFAAATVSVTGGTPTSYTWSFNNIGGGSWSVFSGQGTATASARVINFTNPNSDTTANFNCAVVVGGVTYNVAESLTYSHL